MEKERIEWLDIGKGIGIFLVILGHSLTAVIRNNSQIAMAIYDGVFFIHMPFLFCLSGYSFKLAEKRYLKTSIKKFIFKKGKVLLIPYFIYSFVCYAIFKIANALPVTGSIMKKAGYGEMTFLEWIIGILKGDNLYSLHIWYIYVLFFFVIITFLLKKIYNSPLLTLSIAIIFLYILKTVNLSGFIVALPNFLFLYIYFIIGTFCSFKKISNKNTLYLFVITLFFLIIVYCTPIFSGNDWLIYVATVFLKILTTILLIGISKFISQRKNRIANYLGQHSFELYLFHQPFWGSCYGSVLYGFLGIPILLVVITSIGLSIIVPLYISKLLVKTKYIKFAFGIVR